MSSELDLLNQLRKLTPSRVRLGSNHGVATTQQVLDFQMSHARAKDSILTPLNSEVIKQSFASNEAYEVRSQARDRSEYLRRPDLGRSLDSGSFPNDLNGPFDVVFIIGDGLSSRAVENHAIPVLRKILSCLDDWKVAPIFIAEQARVALADEIGERLNAQFSVMMIGERPGLSVSDSMGIYLTYQPHTGVQDSGRNCISNVHNNGGLSHQAAADKLVWLIRRSRDLGFSGVNLKDEMPAALVSQQDRHFLT